MVRFGVLGPVLAENERGPADLKGSRQRAILARLLIARGRVVPVSWLISGATSRITSPSGLMCGVTFRMIPMSVYSTELMVWPVSVTRELVGIGTVWPTMMLASSLGSGGQSGGLNPLYQIGGPRSIQLALKLQF